MDKDEMNNILKTLLALAVPLLANGCANAFLAHKQLDRNYLFAENGTSVVYGRIAKPPFNREFYLTSRIETSAARPFRGDANGLFAFRLKPGFYQLMLMQAENPMLNQRAPIVDRSNGVDAEGMNFRFQPGKVYYLGDIWYADGSYRFASSKRISDSLMAIKYPNFDSSKSEFNDHE